MGAQDPGAALAARIAGLEAPAGGWSAPARAAARARLAAMGLPGRRDEYWRYTDPATLAAPHAPAEEPAPLVPATQVFDGVARLTLVFVDGVFDAARSDPPELAGVEISRLAAVRDAPGHWAGALYGTLEAAGQVPVARPFAALNTAFAADGVLIRATGRPALPVALLCLASRPGADAMLHHCIRVEPGASLTLLDFGPVAARADVVTEVEVAEGGAFHLIRAQGRLHERRAVTHLFARLAAGAVLKAFTLTANGRLTRNEAVVDLAGPGAVAHLAGAAIGDGAFHHDDTVFLTHSAPGCESRQVFKKALKNGATGVFQGKILVRAEAQKTDGYQKAQALLLDETSQFLARPELEIYADDVKCSHGATAGAIDETALFYLRARGIPLAEARRLMVLSFLGEAMEEVEDPALAAEVVRVAGDWLLRHGGA